jgi:hypothetical protein
MSKDNMNMLELDGDCPPVGKTSQDLNCMVCYEDTTHITPCCKQSFCTKCANNWAEKNNDPTCPGCRELYYKSLHQLEGTEIFLSFKKKGKDTQTLSGTLVAVCSKTIKLKTHDNRIRYIKYKNIAEYKPACAPNAFTCAIGLGLLRPLGTADHTYTQSSVNVLREQYDDSYHQYEHALGVFEQLCIDWALDIRHGARRQNIYLPDFYWEAYVRDIFNAGVGFYEAIEWLKSVSGYDPIPVPDSDSDASCDESDLGFNRMMYDDGIEAAAIRDSCEEEVREHYNIYRRFVGRRS